MVRLEMDQVVMRRMKEDDIEVVKALIKVCLAVLVTLRVKFMKYSERCFLFLSFYKLCLFLSRRAVRAQRTVSSSTS